MAKILVAFDTIDEGFEKIGAEHEVIRPHVDGTSPTKSYASSSPRLMSSAPPSTTQHVPSSCSMGRSSA